MSEDDFEVGPQILRPVTPVGFNRERLSKDEGAFALNQKWEDENDSGPRTATVPHSNVTVDTNDSSASLTKEEAITLAKLIVAYPFLMKVL